MLIVLGVLPASWSRGADSGPEADLGVSRQEVTKEAFALEEEPGAPRSLWTREALTGDWGGYRRRLADLGIALELVYTGDVIAIVSGGVHRRASYLDDVDLMLTAEGEPGFGWRGASLFVYGLGVGGTGSPTANAGDLQALDNIDAPKTWKLYEAWFQQELLAGRLSFLVGLYDLNSEFDVLETASLFLNSSFGVGRDLSQSGLNGPSIFPITSVGVRVKAEPVEHTYLQVVGLDGMAGSPDQPHGTQIDFGSKDGLILVGEMGYVGHAPGESDAPYTKVGLGGWFYTAKFDTVRGVDGEGNPLQRRGNYGVYLLAERQVYSEPGAPAQGLALFVRIGFAESEFNPVGLYTGGGGVYTGLLPGRPGDQLGIGVAAAHAGDDFERASREAGAPVRSAEIALEATYAIRATPWLTVQPDFQYIMNPGLNPALRNAIALGTRLEVRF